MPHQMTGKQNAILRSLKPKRSERNVLKLAKVEVDENGPSQNETQFRNRVSGLNTLMRVLIQKKEKFDQEVHSNPDTLDGTEKQNEADPDPGEEHENYSDEESLKAEKRVHFASDPEEADSSHSAGDGIRQCQQFNNLQTKVTVLQTEYYREQEARREAEKAYENLTKIHEFKMRKFKKAVEGNRQAFQIAEEMKEKYDGLRNITEETMTKLDDANGQITLLKQFITHEKRKTEKMRNEMNLLKQPPVPDHSTCDALLEQERKDKQIALEQIEEMSEEMKDIQKENEKLKNTNREWKKKIEEIHKIKNDLTTQNQTFMFQFDLMEKIINDKDNQIKTLLERNPLNEPIVQKNLESLESAHASEQAEWRKKEEGLNDVIELFKKDKENLESMVEQRIVELQNLSKKHQLLKRECNEMAEKFAKDMAQKDKHIVALLEATKCMKTEMNQLKCTHEKRETVLSCLKEENRVKDIEIRVLGDAKNMYEKQIEKYQYEKEAVYHIAKEFEQQIESAREKLNELETHKCELYRQLAEANDQLQKGRESGLIQQKILEDTRDTVAMLKTRLKECSHQLSKSEREKERLLCERDYCH